MTKQRESMENELKKYVIPLLRKAGFKGSFPHFRRYKDGYIDLLSFQFSSAGGSFVIELAKCRDDIVSNTETSKITAQAITDKRVRLSPDIQKIHDYWFVFDKKPLFVNIYRKIANEVNLLLINQAENWWSNEKNISREDSFYGFVALRKQ